MWCKSLTFFGSKNPLFLGDTFYDFLQPIAVDQLAFPAGPLLELSTLAIAEQQSEGVNAVNEAVEGITATRKC